MGTFLSMTSVIGKTKQEVINSLMGYAKTVGGGLEKENLSIESPNCCVIEEARGNTTIFNPYAYMEWDASSEFLSRDLKAPVFSFHIHDGDLWMYVLFVNGHTVDQFNPIPDYWSDDISEEDMNDWKGNAATIASHVKGLNKNQIEKYLVRWDLDADEAEKAYAEDEFGQEDWQLLDFMKKLGLPYPLEEDGKPKGETYKLWTTDLPLQQSPGQSPARDKPWWKFW